MPRRSTGLLSSHPVGRQRYVFVCHGVRGWGQVLDGKLGFVPWCAIGASLRQARPSPAQDVDRTTSIPSRFRVARQCLRDLAQAMVEGLPGRNLAQSGGQQKASRANRLGGFGLSVSPTGFEPVTSCSGGHHRPLMHARWCWYSKTYGVVLPVSTRGDAWVLRQFLRQY